MDIKNTVQSMKRKKQKKIFTVQPFMEIKSTCSQNTTNFRRPPTNKTMYIKHIRMITFEGKK